MPLRFSLAGWLSDWSRSIAPRKKRSGPRVVDLSEAVYSLRAPVVDESRFEVAGELRPTSRLDRAGGRQPPLFTCEQDLHRNRGLARSLAAIDEHAIGILENLTNYVLGPGFSYGVTGKSDGLLADELAVAARQVIDEFLDRHDWKGDFERELFVRAHRDGEFFLALEADRRGVKASIVEPERVTEPADADKLEAWLGMPPCDWSFGVAAAEGGAGDVRGYFEIAAGSNGSAAGEWRFHPAERVVHGKLNVDHGAKRGVSDFLAVFETLERADRLLGNTLQGAAVRAAIAYITEHAEGVGAAAVQNLTSTLSDAAFTVRTPSGVRTVKLNQREAGTRLDVEHGRKFHAGMQGSPEGPSHVQVLQAALRRVGARWCMPEYMTSADASNANYASTLVAESPFVKAAEAQQAHCRRWFRETLWKVLTLACESGRLPNIAVLRRTIDITIETPTIAVRNRKEELEIRQALFAAGILSKRTWAEQSGIDYDREHQRRKSEIGSRRSEDGLEASDPDF